MQKFKLLEAENRKIKQRVGKGNGFLHGAYQGDTEPWYWRINNGILDMSIGHLHVEGKSDWDADEDTIEKGCIGNQLEGSYSNFLIKHGLDYDAALNMGFCRNKDLDSSLVRYYYDLLTTEWCRVLRFYQTRYLQEVLNNAGQV